jgi:osmotically-inducible protein OsmY
MKRIRSIYSVGTFILVAAMSGCATHNACPGSGCTPDEDTTAAVNAVISSHPDLGPPNQIQVSTINHVVYLTGIVDTGYQRKIAASLAANTNGVARVVDSISLSK